MNERTKELAKQAGAHWNHGDFNMGSSVEFQEGDLNKFAELIILECCDLIENGIPTSTYRNMIKQHFGVCNEKV